MCEAVCGITYSLSTCKVCAGGVGLNPNIVCMGRHILTHRFGVMNDHCMICMISHVMSLCQRDLA